ncbi:MAG: DUF559 domain-containing protein, partial [Anaerolineae bacterium]|nr:DUF559 domain-containing protein [Anaerolineae bacterium]
MAQQKRIEPTPAEQALWKRLRKDQLAGVKFRRQHTFGPFIVDFYAHDAGLIIEVDGPIHEYTQQEDALRQEYLESLGLRVLRFRNEDVLDDIERVLQAIAAALPSTALSPSPQTRRDQPGLDRAFGTTPSPSLLAGRGPGGGVFYPEDVFAYAYAVFHSPTYRARYAEFLKIDFPRLPLTSDPELFAALVEMGAELVDLHLLRAPAVNRFITTFPAEGDGRVERSYPKYDEKLRRVTINKTQYFEGVPPQVWTFYVGGYQVLEKWLKDRRERVLTWDDIQHYQRIVVALAETIRLMEEI